MMRYRLGLQASTSRGLTSIAWQAVSPIDPTRTVPRTVGRISWRVHNSHELVRFRHAPGMISFQPEGLKYHGRIDDFGPCPQSCLNIRIRGPWKGHYVIEETGEHLSLNRRLILQVVTHRDQWATQLARLR